MGHRVRTQKDPQQAAHQEAEKNIDRCPQQKLPGLGKCGKNEVHRLYTPAEVALLSDMFQTDLHQIRHVLVIQGVIKDRSLAAVSNEGQILEPAKLMGDGRLTQGKKSSQVTDAHFTTSKGHHDPEASRITQHLIRQRQPAQFGIRYGFPARKPNPFQVDDPDAAPILL